VSFAVDLVDMPITVLFGRKLGYWLHWLLARAASCAITLPRGLGVRPQ
jgi:hypothetical protein